MMDPNCDRHDNMSEAREFRLHWMDSPNYQKRLPLSGNTPEMYCTSLGLLFIFSFLFLCVYKERRKILKQIPLILPYIPIHKRLKNLPAIFHYFLLKTFRISF